jgi:phytoene desaturase
LACIPAIESHHGAWYVRGGLARLRDALVRLAEKVGVTLRSETGVQSIRATGDRVSGVVLESGGFLATDVVVANVDALHLYRDLLNDSRAAQKVARVERSSSGFVVLAAVRGTTEGLGHHNIVFSDDYRTEFDDLFRRAIPARSPTVYACVSACTDPTQAPDGDENWFLLVNAPSAPVAWARDAYAERIWDVVERRFPGVHQRVSWSDTITPHDIARRFTTPGGAIYGTSSNGLRAAFRRPVNRGPRAGLYLAGGSSHPGGGLPLVAQSGAIAADAIAADYPCG